MKTASIVCTFLAGMAMVTVLLLTASLVLAADTPGITVGYTVPADISPEERKWYKTFQEGNLLTDGWVDISRDILARLPANEQPEHQKSLLQLGDKIGREWAKNNTSRKIDTGMLKKWGKQLQDASRKNPEALTRALASIGHQVDSILR